MASVARRFPSYYGRRPHYTGDSFISGWATYPLVKPALGTNVILVNDDFFEAAVGTVYDFAGSVAIQSAVTAEVSQVTEYVVSGTTAAQSSVVAALLKTWVKSVSTGMQAGVAGAASLTRAALGATGVTSGISGFVSRLRAIVGAVPATSAVDGAVSFEPAQTAEECPRMCKMVTTMRMRL